MTECNEQEMLGVEGGILRAFAAGYAIGSAIYDAYAEEIGDAIDAMMT